MTTYVHGDTAAKLLSLSIALHVAADRLEAGLPATHDTDFLIAQGRTLVRSIEERGEVIGAGLPRLHLWLGSAEFMRAWARFCEPPKAADLVRAAAGLEAAGDLAIDMAVTALQRSDA
jgi:hypothetical protein